MKRYAVVVAVLGLIASSVQAQSVIFQISGRAYAKDSFGSGGTVDNLIAAVAGTNLTRSESAMAGAASSSATITATDNVATFSLETLAATGFGGGFNLFIFDAIAEMNVDAYVLGAPGTPYALSVVGTGSFQVVDAGFGSNIVDAGTLGVTDPGFAFTWGGSGGTFTTSDFTDSNTLLFGGQVYSRVRPMARSSARSWFGISGYPPDGFGSYYATHSVTMTVNSLASGSSAPEPGTLVLLLPGTLIWLARRRTR